MDERQIDQPKPKQFSELERRNDDQPVEVEWLVLKLLRAIGGNPRYAVGLDPRYVVLAIERWTDEEASELVDRICRGLYLMAHGLDRAALTEFESALDGRADGQLEPLPRLALEAHAFSLLHLGCERDAMREFERLLREQADDETQDRPSHKPAVAGSSRRSLDD